MKNLNSILNVLMISCVAFLVGCDSVTLIDSIPSGASITIDGNNIGTTPIYHRDTKIIFSSTTIKLEKEGFEPLNAYFNKNEKPDWGAIVSGCFTVVPFLWSMKYNPTHNYRLKPKPKM